MNLYEQLELQTVHHLYNNIKKEQQLAVETFDMSMDLFVLFVSKFITNV